MREEVGLRLSHGIRALGVVGSETVQLSRAALQGPEGLRRASGNCPEGHRELVVRGSRQGMKAKPCSFGKESTCGKCGRWKAWQQETHFSAGGVVSGSAGMVALFVWGLGGWPGLRAGSHLWRSEQKVRLSPKG